MTRPVPLWSLLVAAGVFGSAGVWVGFAVGPSAARRADGPAAGPAPEPAARRSPPVPRGEFRTAVLRRGERDVLAAVGKPDATAGGGGAGAATYWVYHRRTTDPVTGAVDNRAVLTLDATGLFTEVAFFN